MAVISPILLTSSLVTDVLTKIRRGVALARMDNTADFAAGVMCDLPEKIDFELNLVSKHQFLTREVTVAQSESSIDSDTTHEHEASLRRESGLSVGTKVRGSASSEVGLSSSTSATRESEVQQDTSNQSAIQASRNGSSGNDLDLDGTVQTQVESDAEASAGGTTSSSNGVEAESESNSSAGGGTEMDSTNESGAGGEAESSNETRSGTGTTRNTQSDNESDTGSKSDNSLETECSDKCQLMAINRRYWRLDEDTGAIQQAS